MCIAVYIPKHQNISDEIIRNCFMNNPDGAGIMYQKAGKVTIKKGFFSVEELIKAFREIPTKYHRALHCRIATSGKISAQCCHPFPITDDLKQMGVAEQTVNGAVIHNGVISFCTPHEGLLSPYSDTMLFTKDYLHYLGDMVLGRQFKKLFEEASTSKLLIFKGKKIALVGKWTEDNGVFYSNTGYKSSYKLYYGKGGKTAIAKTNYNPYSLYGYDYGYGDSYYEEYPDATDTWADVKQLGFTIGKDESVNIDDLMEDIIDELNKMGCVPDRFSCYETFVEDPNEYVFEVSVLKTPPTETVCGYEYYTMSEI